MCNQALNGGLHAQVSHAYRGVEDFQQAGETIWDYAHGVAVSGHAQFKSFDVNKFGLAINGVSTRQKHQVGDGRH